jgi:hypothetical protein
MSRRRGRVRTPSVIASVLALSLGAAMVGGTAAATPPSHLTPRLESGLSLVQYAETSPMPLPWNAHLLNGSDPTLSTVSGPRAAPDAEGGVQVTFRNPQGDVIWLDGAAVGRFHDVDLTTLLGLPPIAGVPVPVIGADGLDQVYCVTTGGRLYQLTWNPYLRIPGRFGLVTDRYDLWYPVNLTAIGRLQVTGTPSVVVDGSTTDVFARTTGGDLVEYQSPGVAGQPWSAFDLTVESGGPRVETDPAAFYDPTSSEVRVASTELSSAGHVVVFSPTDVGGRIWAAEDVTKATSTPIVSGGLAAAMDGANPVLFGAGPTGDLLEYLGSDSGTSTSWLESDLTATTEGSPPIVGTPAVAVSGSELVVAGVAASWGDLFEWTKATPSAPFIDTDVSITGQGPARTIVGTPAAAFWGHQLSLFGAGVGVPAPEGTGVYAIPSAKWPQAVKDGWPVLGVTGGLGATCAPWTGFVTPPGQTSSEPDEFVGHAIQQSHVRETWLSFWTVSGPGTQVGPGCTPDKAPYTSKTFYDHGYLAGQWVATQIDTYRGAGLGLKPDWVIFDPEGYPDNHSGLWGPTSPPSALGTSVADWYAILAGWKAGLDSIDPSLRAAVYANQYEYMTYKLFDQPLPTFIAGAFAQQLSGKTKVLVAPTRSAYGPNIRGFVMFNSNFTPTCSQVDDERQLLTEAPWFGDYNTIQVPPGSYCAPGTNAG